MEVEKTLKALEVVLDFNKRVIISALIGKSISEEAIEKIRKSCEILTQANVYSFDVNCTLSELVIQIQQFVEYGLNNSK